MDIIKEYQSLKNNSIRIYWDGDIPKDDTIKALVTLVNEPLAYIEKNKINANKYIKVDSIEHGIKEFKKLYEHIYNELFDDSIINVSYIDSTKDIYLLIYLA